MSGKKIIKSKGRALPPNKNHPECTGRSFVLDYRVLEEHVGPSEWTDEAMDVMGAQTQGLSGRSPGRYLYGGTISGLPTRDASVSGNGEIEECGEVMPGRGCNNGGQGMQQPPASLPASSAAQKPLPVQSAISNHFRQAKMAPLPLRGSGPLQPQQEREMDAWLRQSWVHTVEDYPAAMEHGKWRWSRSRVDWRWEQSLPMREGNRSAMREGTVPLLIMKREAEKELAAAQESYNQGEERKAMRDLGTIREHVDALTGHIPLPPIPLVGQGPLQPGQQWEHLAWGQHAGPLAERYYPFGMGEGQWIWVRGTGWRWQSKSEWANGTRFHDAVTFEKMEKRALQLREEDIQAKRPIDPTLLQCWGYKGAPATGDIWATKGAVQRLAAEMGKPNTAPTGPFKEAVPPGQRAVGRQARGTGCAYCDPLRKLGRATYPAVTRWDPAVRDADHRENYREYPYQGRTWVLEKPLLSAQPTAAQLGAEYHRLSAKASAWAQRMSATREEAVWNLVHQVNTASAKAALDFYSKDNIMFRENNRLLAVLQGLHRQALSVEEGVKAFVSNFEV